MHMGFVPDAHVTALRRAPAGDPTVYGIDGMEIALRVETAKAIRVRNLESPDRKTVVGKIKIKDDRELAGARDECLLRDSGV